MPTGGLREEMVPRSGICFPVSHASPTLRFFRTSATTSPHEINVMRLILQCCISRGCMCVCVERLKVRVGSGYLHLSRPPPPSTGPCNPTCAGPQAR